MIAPKDRDLYRSVGFRARTHAPIENYGTRHFPSRPCCDGNLPDHVC